VRELRRKRADFVVVEAGEVERLTFAVGGEEGLGFFEWNMERMMVGEEICRVRDGALVASLEERLRLEEGERGKEDKYENRSPEERGWY